LEHFFFFFYFDDMRTNVSVRIEMVAYY
jgi:hypothetical protein